MRFLKSKEFIFAHLALVVQAQPTMGFITQNTTLLVIYIFLIVALTAVSLFIFYDRRQNYFFLNAARNRLVRIRDSMSRRLKVFQKKEENNQKLVSQEQMSSKANFSFIQTQKSCRQGDNLSIQQTTIASSSLPNEVKQNEMFVQSPQINLKQVFDKNDKKQSKKSRSKLKNRVQIKKSQLENEDQVIEDNSACNEELQNSLDNSQG